MRSSARARRSRRRNWRPRRRRRGAQVAPDLHWRTITTEHFRVNFGPGLEPVARRAAGSIERAYGRLAKELHEPRGPIDLTIADNLDVSNGYATVFPTNRIVIYACPPIDALSLGFLDDWIDLVVTHELTHIFHLDRTAGWWRVAQRVFGRNPFLFPNLYTPSWLDEGIAVYYESRLTGSGRIVGTDHAMIVRAQALDSLTPGLNALSASTLRYPLGQTPYAYGSLLMDFVARTQGAAKMRAFVDESAGRTIPFLLNSNAKRGFGVSFDSAWRAWTDSIRRDAFSLAARSTPIRDITSRGWTAERIRWIDPAHVAYASDDGRSLPALRAVAIARRAAGDARRAEVARCHLSAPERRARVRRGRFRGPVHAAQRPVPRTRRPDAPADRGRAPHAARRPAARRRERRISRDRRRRGAVDARRRPPGPRRRSAETPSTITPLTGTSPDTIWSEPRWSHDGTRIAATRWMHGAESEIAILDAAGRVLGTVGRSHAETHAPSWGLDDRTHLFHQRSQRPFGALSGDRGGWRAGARGGIRDRTVRERAESRRHAARDVALRG